MRSGAKCLYTGSRPELYTDKRYINCVLTVYHVSGNLATCHNLNYFCDTCGDYLPEVTTIQINVKDLQPLKPGTLKHALIMLYATLNPDILAGLQDHITTITDTNKTITQIINEYTNKHPNNAAMKRDALQLAQTNCISDLEGLYILIDFLAEEINA